MNNLSTAPGFIPTQPQAIPLGQLLSYVQRTIGNAFPTPQWIVAEVSSISRNPRSQHCYLELVQSEHGMVKAQVRANMWQASANQILPKFFNATGAQIAAGMELMLYVKVEMHVVYGLSLTIYDVNPDFTLGQHERVKRETIQRLQAEGIWQLNQMQHLPRLLQRIAVITSETAAGWGDFQRQISESPFAPFLKLELFPAMMQGADAVRSIATALDRIHSRLQEFDAVVIIRGGGSKLDLALFDEYTLCCLIANFPAPIITGIGHERDVSVVDMIAHTSHKTPTAVAAFLVRNIEAVLQQLLLAEERLSTLLANKQAEQQEQIGKVINHFQHTLLNLQQNADKVLRLHTTDLVRLLTQSKGMLAQMVERSENRANQVLRQLENQSDRQEMRLSEVARRLERSLLALPETLEKDLEHYTKLIELYHPRTMMQKGFFPLTLNGKQVHYLHELTPNAQLTILMQEGEAHATIMEVTPNEE